jgi:hypothetical protein
MPKLLLTNGVQDWEALLADPHKQWQEGFSARTLAHCWEAAPASGLPPEIQTVFDSATEPTVAGFKSFLAIPEFAVPLPGGGHQSQNDLFLLGRSPAGAIAVVVEGKVSESFGPSVGNWCVDASLGKRRRLNFLKSTLGVSSVPDEVPYQLLHRAASAIVEGSRYRAVAAVMLVHSFSQALARWNDYATFLGLFGVEARLGVLQRLNGEQTVPLFAAWVKGDPRYLTA